MIHNVHQREIGKSSLADFPKEEPIFLILSVGIPVPLIQTPRARLISGLGIKPNDPSVLPPVAVTGKPERVKIVHS